MMVTETPILGANMRYRAWLRLALLSILLGSATAAQTQPAAPASNRPPAGNLDQVDTKGQVAGWSADSDRPSAPMQVMLAVDGVDLSTPTTIRFAFCAT